MIVDLHSHTAYSSCGKDAPEDLVKTMIRNGVDELGITDHNYGIADRKHEYYDLLTSLKEKYQSEIKIIRGIELNTFPDNCLNPCEDISYFDYCLIEHLGLEGSILRDDIVSYAKNLGTRAGIAHTDLFDFTAKRGLDLKDYLVSLKNAGIFWEMNVTYDSIHGYHEHEYVKKFVENKSLRDVVKESGVEISVGFDGHRMNEYRADRVKQMCDFLTSNNFPLVVF